MTELPVTPPSTSGFASKQPNRLSELTAQESPGEGDEAASLFNLAFQASLSVEQVEPVAGWPGASLTPDALLPAQLSGERLPVLTGRGGNGLPPTAQATSEPADFFDLQLLNVSLSGAKTNGAQQGQLFREIQTGILASVGGIEEMPMASEGDQGRPTGQFSIQSLQGVNGGFAPRGGATVLSVEAPVGQPGWDRELGERIHWMVGRNIQNAEIKLTPPHLGPLEIRISVQNDQTSVSFVAAQASTREALEAAIPRLREMLGDANLNLANVNVGGGEGSAHWGREQAHGQAGRPSHGDFWGGGEAPEGSEVLASHQTKGLVDHYV